MECRLRENKASCPCGYADCERHGVCCECLRYHISTKSLPACLKNQDWIQGKR